MATRPTNNGMSGRKRKMLERLIRFFERPGLDRQLNPPPNRPKLSDSVPVVESDSEPAKPQVEYVPPANEVVEQWAKQVSQHMADLKDDPRYTTPEVQHGLSAFMKLVAKVKAQQMNKGDSDFDTESEAR